MDTLLQDVRYAIRSLARQPAFAAIAILTLALGIGANTAIFSAVNAILLHPVEAPRLDRLVVIQDDMPGLQFRNAQLSPSESEDLFARTDLFSASGAYTGGTATLTGAGEPRRLRAAWTMGRFFDVFAVRPHLGRFYRAEESEEGQHQVVVLSYGLWQELSGGDPSFVGRTIEIDARPYQVIGVMPREFRFPRTAQLFMPKLMNAAWRSPDRRATLTMQFVGRMRDGLTMERLRAGLDDEARRWHERWDYPAEYQHALVTLPFVQWLAGELRPILLVLLGAVGIVLLIACANVASLQLVRASRRAREIAVRAAIGAGRGRLVRQLLVESGVLALAGGLAGLWLGTMLVQGLAAWAPAGYPELQMLRLDGSVLAFTAGAAVLAGLLFGTLPAWRAGQVDAHEVLRESGRGLSGGLGKSRFLRGSVVAQVALALVLLLGSGVTVRSLARLMAVDPGFRPEHAVTMRIDLPKARYARLEQAQAFEDQLLERLRAIPGVEAVGATYGLPFSDQGNSSPFDIIGEPPLASGQRHANMWFVDGDYFRAMGIQLLRGRAFEPTDRDGSPWVAVIDEQLAKQYFPGQDPIGRRISQGPEATIIGIVRSVKSSELGAPDKATIYYTYRQATWVLGNFAFVARGTIPADRLAAEMRGAATQIDPQLVAFDVQPMTERIAQSLGSRRLAMMVLTGFAALSLVLALLGIYGVISYGTAQRTREFGIRIALGARPGDVTGMVLRQGALLAAVGMTLGTLAYLATGRALSALLYGITPTDPLTLAAGILLVLPIALLACWLPARRASRVDPVEALTVE
ncbi:MAG TPA: ABC transporter permease [Gemmatimonadaceae bacterium]|nr:ABC transporter permease [Gemmatimonadaceae bacterium]